MPKQFDCPFCNHHQTVECTIDKHKQIGVIKCRVCSVKYQQQINALTDPIDLYGEWIDECERLNAAEGGEGDAVDEFDD